MAQQKSKSTENCPITLPDKEWLSMCEAITTLLVGNAMTWKEFALWEDARHKESYTILHELHRRWREETDEVLRGGLDDIIERLRELRGSWPSCGRHLYREARRLEKAEGAAKTAIENVIARIENAVRAGHIEMIGYRKGSNIKEAITSDTFQIDYTWLYSTDWLVPPVLLRDRERFGEWERVQIETASFREWIARGITESKQNASPTTHEMSGVKKKSVEQQLQEFFDAHCKSLDLSKRLPSEKADHKAADDALKGHVTRALLRPVRRKAYADANIELKSGRPSKDKTSANKKAGAAN